MNTCSTAHTSHVSIGLNKYTAFYDSVLNELISYKTLKRKGLVLCCRQCIRTDSVPNFDWGVFNMWVPEATASPYLQVNVVMIII